VKRRDLLKLALSAGAIPLAAGVAKSAAVVTPKIKDVQVIETAPAGLRLTVVKILTDQDGLYGYGDGTFTQRADLVRPAIERYLKPFLIGKRADRIEDIWQSCYDSSYWKNGPILNNAISAVDQALWDIKGRQAGMPVYELVGGKTREAVDTYTHASGTEIQQTIDQAKGFIAKGFRNIRVQVGVPGYAAYGSGRASGTASDGSTLVQGEVFEPVPYMRRALKLFEECRKQLPEETQLLHDVHERVSPNQAVQFAKDVEKFKLFYLEDVLSPEDIAYFRQIRSQCSTPLAMGELFNSPHEWNPLISERLIDYIRVHVSQAGGFTPCRKMAILAETFGVRTAWHGPGDISPIGHAANVTLDLVSTSFGIQEYSAFNERVQEVFHGCPTMKDGYLWINEAPGWGIEIDEAAAKKYPFGYGESGDKQRLNGGWGEVRKRDGSVIKQ
jgi:mannonate dehydratase